ncbi:MAG: hypothetical protein VB087_02775 [Candidatus Limiplasma sp.]|nr:hypothetical protein [Candidatus Limiplasma sp.]MEA5146290.1 hypothetical protein [Candidatus Limiplasma sp.]
MQEEELLIMSEQNNPLGPEGSYFDAKALEEARALERKWDGIYPVFITILYLVLGFLFQLWHPGWLLFLTIPLYYMKPKTEADRWLNPVMITLIYLVLGFFFNLWHPGWMIFLAIPVAEILRKA